MTDEIRCPVCQHKTDTFKFNVMFHNTKRHEGFEQPYYQYNECLHCGAYHCSTMRDWTHKQFADMVYNDGYAEYDGDINNPYGNRPTFHINLLWDVFMHFQDKEILDYGCGKGFVVENMNEAGWHLSGYDPFNVKYNGTRPIEHCKYALITAFEVLEHIYNPVEVFEQFNGLLHDGGMVYATTDVVDRMVGNIQDNYYTCPRVGHVVLHRFASLEYIACRTGFQVIHMPKDTESGIQGHLFIKIRKD